MRAIATALIAFAAATSPALGQWRDTQTGKPLADTEWRKAVDGLGAALLVTADEEAFLKEWTNTPESRSPTVKPASKVRRGAVVTALVLFSGCGDAGGNCDAAVDFKVLNPDGSVYGDVPGNRAWSGPAPKSGIVVLSSAHLRIRIEPKDQRGEYTVIGVLREAGGKRAVSLKQQFEVSQ